MRFLVAGSHDGVGLKWKNGMLHHLIGEELIFLYMQHFVAPTLDLRSCLQVRGLMHKTCFVSRKIKFEP